jgi:hypothetical protein
MGVKHTEKMEKPNLGLVMTTKSSINLFFNEETSKYLHFLFVKLEV